MNISTIDPVAPEAWAGFTTGPWADGIDVRDFIQRNYTPYEGDDTFLAGPTERTTAVWDADRRDVPRGARARASTTSTRTPRRPSRRTRPGYIDKDNELIVGLQTDAPLKRAIMPNGGYRMVENALTTYGYEPDAAVARDLHQVPQDAQRRRLRRLPVRRAQGALARTSSPACPDAYGRGRIIGDYRRVALYGVDALIAAKQRDRSMLDMERSVENVIRDREELAEQIRALGELKDDGRLLRLRHLRPGDQRPRGRAVAVLRLPRRGEGAERRGDVARPHLDLPGRLPAARPRRRRRSPRSRRRSSSTTSSSSCGSCASCAPRSTTRCSPATRRG